MSIKFAFLGYLRFVELLGCGDLFWVGFVFGFLGTLDAALKIDTETDIKKIVAYQTVVEMHVLFSFITLDVDAFFDIILFILAAHG